MTAIDHPLWLTEYLTDGVVTLDGHRLDDAEAHWSGEDDEIRLRFESPGRPTLEQVADAIGRWITARAAGGPMIAYAVREQSGVLVGGCELRRLTPERADVSYWIYPRFRRRGLARRALALLVGEAAMTDGLQWLEAHIDANNIASRRLVERLGFEAKGTVEDEAPGAVNVSRLLYVLPLGAWRRPPQSLPDKD